MFDFIMAYMPYKTAHIDAMHRRLATPNYTDVLVITGLSCFLLFLLYKLIQKMDIWTRTMRRRVKKIVELRTNVRDSFRAENGYSWDYCFVYPVYKDIDTLTEDQVTWNLKRVVRELTDSGLDTKMFYSCQADEVYIKVRASLDRLMKEADRINMKLPLDKVRLRETLKHGRYNGKQEVWGPVNIPDESLESSLSPYDYIYAKYEYQREEVAPLYKIWDNRTIFRGVDRLKLIFSIMTSRKVDGGASLDVNKMVQQQAVLAFFPLHDRLESMSLQMNWINIWQMPWNQPVDDVKDYYGEKIGLYFLWLGHYTSWLLFAGIIGGLCWINVAMKENDPNAVIMPYFACFMAVWATMFLEFWKRKENAHAMKWGMVGFEAEEQTRPQFEGVSMPSPISGQDYLYFSRNEATKRFTFSVIVIFFFIALVIAVVGSIFVLKLVLSTIPSLSYGDTQLAGIIASIANAIQIQIMNMIYGGIAIRLTNYENHRTDTQYEDALISKTFVFQFVNSFAALFYISFIKPFIYLIDPCLGPCMSELQTNLGTIFLTRLALGSTLKVIIPTLMTHLNTQGQTEGAIHDQTEAEKEYDLAEYHVMLGTFADYADASIQYGYATMFISAYPLAAILSFVNNYIQLRVDAWKLLQICRRPEPRSAEDIGTWQAILETVSIFAMLVNAALIAFTGTFAVDQTWTVRAWIFITTASGIYIIKLAVAAIIPDVPAEVEIQIQRSEYIVGKVIHNIQDENDEGLISAGGNTVDFTVKFTDEDQM